MSPRLRIAAGMLVLVAAASAVWLVAISQLTDSAFDGRTLAVLGVSVIILALLVAWAVQWMVHRAHGRNLRIVRESVSALRDNPTPNALHVIEREAAQDSTLRPVVEQLQSLAECHRKALAQIVQSQEKTDRQRDSGTGDLDRHGPAAARYVAGSSRHRMVARLAPNLHWIAATQPLQEFLGCRLKELIARSFLEHVHPHDSAALRQTLQEALKDGEGHNITFRFLVADTSSALRRSGEITLAGKGRTLSGRASASSGSTQPPNERHIQMDVMTCYTEAGAALHLRCHILDITDRVLTEERLARRTEELTLANARLRQINTDIQRLKESYRDLYHHAPVMYFSLDVWGQFVAFNETMLRTLGYPREALMGQPYTCLLTPPGRAGFLKDPSVLQLPGEVEAQWIKQDGTVIDVLIDTTTVKDSVGKFVRSRSAARDVTERRRLSADLLTKAEELWQANAQLRRTNQELEEFTYVVSHDLKEPLRTLQAFSNFLSMDYGPRLDEEGHEYINHLMQASRRLGALIDDLLSLSRAGRVINVPRPFAWDETIATVFGDLQDLIQRTHAAVRVDGPLPPVHGDPERIGQLLTNLVSNGLKYNKNSKPEVVIGTKSGYFPLNAKSNTKLNGAKGAESGPITLFVRDNGIGIDPQYHDQIFRIFRRLHRREEVEGTGAGLAICKKIVEAHGGHIWVESKPGEGATFYFTLPRLPVNLKPPPPPGVQESATRVQEPGTKEPGTKSKSRAKQPVAVSDS
jgi:PAS domain S-box-containing protein